MGWSPCSHRARRVTCAEPGDVTPYVPMDLFNANAGVRPVEVDVSDSNARIQSLDDYWAFYLGEHRAAPSRWLHFLGTSAFFVAVCASVVAHPVVFPAAFAVVMGIAWWGCVHAERQRPAFLAFGCMIALAVLASPTRMAAGVVGAYLCAWLGHFVVEGNRPATFKYPVWSFLSDFRMWGEMVRGRLWTGDPLDELGLAKVAPEFGPDDVAWRAGSERRRVS